MTNKSISQLTAGGAVSSTDIFPDVQTAGVGPVKVTAAQIGTYVLSGSGLTGILPVANGGTGLSSLTAGYIPFGNGTSALGNSSNLFWDSANSRLGVGTSSPGTLLSVNGVTSIAAGSASAPSLAYSSSTNTGLFFPASNTLAFATNGSERLRIDSSGAVGIGAVPTSGQSTLLISKNATGNATQYLTYTSGQIQSDVTSSCRYFQAVSSTAAASFTLNDLHYFNASQGTFGSGSTVTAQYGFHAQSNLTGATNNYGFYSNIASGSNRWNFYAAGTADNYFAGSVGVGAVPIAGYNIYNVKSLTGATSSYGYSLNATSQSDVTTAAYAFQSTVGTAASSFTLSSLYHFQAYQSTIGAGSTVTNQYGFAAAATLTGATNNYGFYSNIASGTGRWNFYAAGTADNYFAGNVGIGVASPSVTLQMASSAASTGMRLSNSGTLYVDFYTNSTSTTFNNVQATPLIFGTNNTERLRIDSVGNIGIGGVPTAGYTLTVAKNITGATNSYAIYSNGIIQSDVTSSGYGFASAIATAAASFTLSNLTHFRADQGTIGAGSTVTSQYGFQVGASLTGATNNYGFYSNIASGSNRWNFYAGGTANNAFAGNSRFGGTSAPVATVDVTGSVAATTTILSTGATSGIGYATGAGGAVTQATSRTTGVTLNNVSGAITLFSAAGSTTAATFTVTNSAVAATDVIHISQKSGTNLYVPLVTAVSAGSFNVTFYTTGGTATDAPVFSFVVIKAVAA